MGDDTMMAMLKDTWRILIHKGIKQACRHVKSESFKNSNAWLDCLEYDDDVKRYTLNRRTLKERDIPTDALAVTGAKHHYFMTNLKAPERVVIREDGHLNTSAVSNYLYMVNNDINDANTAAARKPIDLKVIAIVAVGLAAVVLWFWMKGGI